MADVAIVMAVIAGLNVCLATFKEFREFRKDRKNSKAVNALDGALYRELDYASNTIGSEKAGLEKWIEFAEKRSDKQPSVSGSIERGIKNRLDLILKQQINFKKDMELLQALLRKDDESSISQITKLSASIKLKTKKMKVMVTKQYKEMSIELWNLEALADLPDHKSRQFCPGALRLQNRKLPNVQIADIAVSYNTRDGEFVCQYCSLQVGDVRSRPETQTMEQRLLLAKSHLISSASFKEFRALYKCLPCYMAHEDKDFSSADVLHAHVSSVHLNLDMNTLKTKVLEEEEEELGELEQLELCEIEEQPDELEDPGLTLEAESNGSLPYGYGREVPMEGSEATETDGRFGNNAEFQVSQESVPFTQDGGSVSSTSLDIQLSSPQASLWPNEGASVQKNRVVDPMRKKKR